MWLFLTPYPLRWRRNVTTLQSSTLSTGSLHVLTRPIEHRAHFRLHRIDRLLHNRHVLKRNKSAHSSETARRKLPSVANFGASENARCATSSMRLTVGTQATSDVRVHVI